MDIDARILAKKDEIAELERMIAELEAGASDRDVLKAGAEAYMPYDPDTAHKWLTERAGGGKGSGMTANYADKKAEREHDREIDGKIAQAVNTFRQSPPLDARGEIDRNHPDYIALKNTVDSLHANKYSKSGKTYWDKELGENLAQRRVEQRTANHALALEKQQLNLRDEEDRNYNYDLTFEEKAYTAAMDPLKRGDKQFQDVATQLGKVYSNLEEGITNKNAFAINTAVKSMIQAIDNSVVRESEMDIYRNPALLEQLRRLYGKVFRGESYTANDIRMILGVANAAADGVNSRLDPEGDLVQGALNIFKSRVDTYNPRAPEIWTQDQALNRATQGLQGYAQVYRIGPRLRGNADALVEGLTSDWAVQSEPDTELQTDIRKSAAENISKRAIKNLETFQSMLTDPTFMDEYASFIGTYGEGETVPDKILGLPSGHYSAFKKFLAQGTDY